MEFVPHEIEWTPEKAARIWNYYASNVALRQQYFGAQAGRAVAALIDRNVRIRSLGNILDFSCGLGDLIDALLPYLAAGQRLFGVDMSQTSVQAVNERFRGVNSVEEARLIESLPSEFPRGTFSMVVATEVIEHLDSQELDTMLIECDRLLTTGGYLVLTTPNEEEYDAAKVCCNGPIGRTATQRTIVPVYFRLTVFLIEVLVGICGTPGVAGHCKREGGFVLNVENSTDDRTCRLVTMGCKVNQYETQLVKEAFERTGFREATDDEAADVCVVNTCSITAEADSKARQIVRQLAKRNPGTRTIVFGCYATRAPEDLEHLPGVFAVVRDPRELPDVLQRFGVAGLPSGITRFDGHRRAFVKVQDGCILNCTYCIIPYIRPGLQSRAPVEIEHEVRNLVEHGYKEIILTGIHLGHYGVESTRGRSGREPFRLWHLIRQLDRIPGDWRLRLSSLEAAEVGPDFVAALSDIERLCPHFHLCLQSGSDAVLARMKRRYRTGRFLEKLDSIRDRMELPAFSTDVIVGFPGETEAEFQQTLDVCEAAGFMKIHAFPFSPRRGTAAATFPDQVSPEIRKERCRRLAELEQKLSQRYHQSLIGRNLSVLVEAKPASRAGWVQGTACRYAAVEFAGSDADVGKLVDVCVDYPLDHALSARRRSSVRVTEQV